MDKLIPPLYALRSWFCQLNINLSSCSLRSWLFLQRNSEICWFCEVVSSKFNTLINLYKGVTQTLLLKKAIKLFSGDLCRVYFSSKNYLGFDSLSSCWDFQQGQGCTCNNTRWAMHHPLPSPWLHTTLPQLCWCSSAHWATWTPQWGITTPSDLCNRNRLREGDSPQQLSQLCLRRFACCTWTHLSDIWQHLRHIPISCGWLMP